MDTAISLFGDKNAEGIVLFRCFRDYYYGYAAQDGVAKPGYVDLVKQLTDKFSLEESQITGEQNQKDFISLFGAILRMRNLLSSFDEFKGKELISERDLQDYLGRYQDLRDEWKQKRETVESTDIRDDIVFEVELIRQIEINIDYILMQIQIYSAFTRNDYVYQVIKFIKNEPVDTKKFLSEIDIKILPTAGYYMDSDKHRANG